MIDTRAWRGIPALVSVMLVATLAAASGAGDAAGQDHGFTAASGDGRAALPLLPMMAEHQKQNMREHLAAVQGIVAALGRDDMDAVARAASRIGYSEAMGRTCEHMGAAAPAFTERALDFHRTADTIGAAARRGDRSAVLTALDRTLQACVGCHAAYRQEIVDEATWRRLVAAAAPAALPSPTP
jgi:cytochrome c556